MELEKFYDKAYSWILTMGPRIIVAIILLILGQWIIGVVLKQMKRNVAKREVESSIAPFLVSLFGTVMQIILVLVLMQVLGIKMTIFAAVIGSFGVAAGFALSGTLQNFTSGILILLFKPYRVGDIIIAQGQEGIVDSIQIFYTVVTTFDNKTVIVPNSKLSNEVIINVSREGKRRLDVELKFGFGADFETIKKLVVASISTMDYVLKEPLYRIGVSSIEADGYKIMISVWLHAQNFQNARLIFQEELISKLKANGLKLPGMQ